ncbi:hypothetical protein PRIPAC_82789, partial [Pristionchus pacificus]
GIGWTSLICMPEMAFRMNYIALLLLAGAVVEAKVQNVEIKGAVLCDRKREEGVEIELWARDSQNPEDLLDNGRTDADGGFELSGTMDDAEAIEPFIRFTHKCNVEPVASEPANIGCPRTNSTRHMIWITSTSRLSTVARSRSARHVVRLEHTRSSDLQFIPCHKSIPPCKLNM